MDRVARGASGADPRHYTHADDRAEAEYEYRLQAQDYEAEEAGVLDELQADGLFDAGKPGTHIARTERGLDSGLGFRFNSQTLVHRDENGTPIGAAELSTDRFGDVPGFSTPGCPSAATTASPRT
jgi:hypothetical protein